MTELYLNAQSDNGTLTNGQSANPALRVLNAYTTGNRSRSCAVKVVKPIFASDASFERSARSVEHVDLDETGRLHRH
jgi:hypothetical protein